MASVAFGAKKAATRPDQTIPSKMAMAATTISASDAAQAVTT
jgi:hypothetical protein